MVEEQLLMVSGHPLPSSPPPPGRHLCSPFLLMSVLRGEKFRLSRLQGELGWGRAHARFPSFRSLNSEGHGAGLV